MAKRNIKLDVPAYNKCVVFFLICLSGILFFIYVGIVPAHKSIVGLNRKIEDAQLQVDIQETLLPIYKLLKEDFMIDDHKELPFPVKAGLPREQTDEIFTVFREIARKCNMEALSIVPDLNYLQKNSRFLLVNTIVRGDFFSLRKLMIALGELPYLEHIETIDIQQDKDAKEFKMNIWIDLS